MKTLIIIPTYNEREGLPVLLAALWESVPESVEVLIVDDGSPDQTAAWVRQEQASKPRLHLLERSGKLGLGSAYVAGFRWGLQRGFDALIEMDADFSHHPRYLAEHLRLLAEGADVSIGSRYVAGGGTRNWGLGRKLLSRGGSLYSRLILGAPIRDFTGGFNGWRRSVLESLELGSLRSDGYSFQIELKYRAHRLGARIREFPIVFEDRVIGQSKMSRRIVFEAILKVWAFRRAGFRSGTSYSAPQVRNGALPPSTP